MFDVLLVKSLKTPLSRIAKPLVEAGLEANHLTFLGFTLGISASVAIFFDLLMVGLLCLAMNRLCDGLDGAMARLTKPTERGAFLDIVLDFIVYSAIPLAFALRDSTDAPAAAFLIFSFVTTGSTFLAFSIFAKNSGLVNNSLADKSFYYLQGITESTETTIVFALMCFFPSTVTMLCIIFGGLCLITAAMRIRTAYSLLDGN